MKTETKYTMNAREIEEALILWLNQKTGKDITKAEVTINTNGSLEITGATIDTIGEDS